MDHPNNGDDHDRNESELEEGEIDRLERPTVEQVQGGGTSQPNQPQAVFNIEHDEEQMQNSKAENPGSTKRIVEDQYVKLFGSSLASLEDDIPEGNCDNDCVTSGLDKDEGKKKLMDKDRGKRKLVKCEQEFAVPRKRRTPAQRGRRSGFGVRPQFEFRSSSQPKRLEPGVQKNLNSEAENRGTGERDGNLYLKLFGSSLASLDDDIQGRYYNDCVTSGRGKAKGKKKLVGGEAKGSEVQKKKRTPAERTESGRSRWRGRSQFERGSTSQLNQPEASNTQLSEKDVEKMLEVAKILMMLLSQGNK